MLHLVGILFPHINDDAGSKSHQICTAVFSASLLVTALLLLLLTVLQITPEILKHKRHVETKQLKERGVIS